VKGCESCAINQKNLKRAPVHPWDTPDHNWDRVHIDYAGPHLGQYHFLIVVDALSKWVEVKVLNRAPSSIDTIELLDEIFSQHGFPEMLVSDNAQIFRSAEFRKYCNDHAIVQRFSAPNYPQTNGLAEKNVQTFKAKLTAMTDENLPIREKVRRILQKYRATPSACGKSPAERYLGR